MKSPQSTQRLLGHSDDATDPLARAMREAFGLDPDAARLARLGVRIDAAVAEGRGPRLGEVPAERSAGWVWRVGASGAAVVALFAALTVLPGQSPSKRPLASPRVSAPPVAPIRAPSRSPQAQPEPPPQLVESREPLASAAPVSRPVRERRSSTPERTGPLEPQDELELLRRAQTALASNPGAALRLVQEHEQAYPHGLLEQERELLAVAALLALDDEPSARRRGDAFRRMFPHSIHLRRLDRMLVEHGPGAAAPGNRDDHDTLNP